VTFTGLAASVNPPRKKSGSEYVPEFTWWRMPYMASFSSGNFDFVVIVAHIRWGDKDSRPTAGDPLPGRMGGPEAAQNKAEDKDILVMGDFNIPSRKVALFEAITSKGLSIPKALQKLEFGSDLAKGKRYDQILHYAHLSG
jgi:endonuclease/exonuclease/phosphatase family metal-dependent hydrolase